MKYVLAIICALAVASSAHAGELSMTMADGSAMPGPDAVQLMDYITHHDPYRDWGPGAAGRGFNGSAEAHGLTVATYYNAEALAEGIRDLPYGSIIVKEHRVPTRGMTALTVMYKVRKGYNPDAGDWYWAKYTPNGRLQVAGRVAACIKCHKAGEGSDFVFGHEGR